MTDGDAPRIANRERRSDASADRRAWLALSIFLAGFGGMIWAIGSAIGLF